MSRDLADALRALTESGTPRKGDVPTPRGAARRVVAAVPSPGATAGGGGTEAIASPITEVSYASREYHSQTRVFTSPDGFASIVFRPLKSVSFLDANDNPVKMIYQAPPASP